MQSPAELPAQAPPPSAEPPPALVVLAADSAGRQIVSVHVKRAYRIAANGTCTPAERPEPLLFSRPPSEEEGDLGIPESDVIPIKESTDLIVMAEAHAPRGTRSMDVQLQLGAVQRTYRVFGERRCIYRGLGSYSFSEPEPFESVPLCYARAYGGVDPSFQLPEQVRLEDALFLPPDVYPRNTLGMGYVIHETKERLDGLLLPQLENPADLLRPDRLVVGDPERWWRQPFPWSCDWFDALWYPRHGFFGTLPRGIPEDDRELFEVRSGWLQPGLKKRWIETPAADRLDSRFGDAASPALVLPFMTGDETLQLTGVMPGGGALKLRLPGQPPRVTVRLEGKTHEVPVRLNRVLISTLQMGVYLVWHAAFQPPRSLPLRHPTRTERDVPDLEGVRVTADGVHVPSYEEWLAQKAPPPKPSAPDQESGS